VIRGKDYQASLNYNIVIYMVDPLLDWAVPEKVNQG
jgi:hypothetical protein